MAEKFPNLMKTLGYISMSSINSNRINAKRSTLRHLKKNFEIQRQIENLENSKRNMTHDVQDSLNKSNSLFLTRNNVCQKIEKRYIQKAERNQ